MTIAATIPADYSERVYAGVLGKVIGVYLGRPFEGWDYKRIQEKLGDIEYYVHDKLDVPLIVTDDDISGTFTFIRSLADNHADPELSSKQIGESWLNYLIEKRTILWWGGLGNSTEHTAYIRLKNGVHAPESGSIARNGQVVAEQIGAQIFIDGWALVNPGNADQAARMADAAARVSHDGAAVDGAVVLAVMEAMAFVESDTNTLIDTALSYISSDSIIKRLIDDLRAWHAAEPDWRETREKLAANYGYDKYGGNCHMVPNHGLIIHALLHGNDNFSETMKIVNTCGWDTDCNSGNLGCLMGIKLGLEGIDKGLEQGTDWRGPVADRIYIPTADGGRGISDCVTEAVEIASLGRELAGEETDRPANGAQFHFSFPGSVQGFTMTKGEGQITNIESGESRCLRVQATGSVTCGTPVFAPAGVEFKGYSLLASPRVFPGQVLQAEICGTNSADRVSLYFKYYGENDEPTLVSGEAVSPSDQATVLRLEVPQVGGPIFEVGISIESADADSTVDLMYLRWDGEPQISLLRPTTEGSWKAGAKWREAWVNGVDYFHSYGEPYRLIHDSGVGLLMQGTREWRNYEVSADVTPHLARSVGIAARVQGMTRYIALVVTDDQKAQIIRMVNEKEVLAECDFSWELGVKLDMSLRVEGQQIVGRINDTELSASDDSPDLTCGAIALLLEEGRTATTQVDVKVSRPSQPFPTGRENQARWGQST